MSGLLAMGLAGGIVGIAVLCCLVGMVHTLRAPRGPAPAPSAASLDETASVICSACHGGLSGLESHCPACGKRLLYQIPGAPAEGKPSGPSPSHAHRQHHPRSP